METIKTRFLLYKTNLYEIYKGAIQGPLGDIGRHGDSKTNISTNLPKGAMYGRQ